MDTGFKLLLEFATDTMKFVLAMNGCEYDGFFERREEWIPDTFEYVFGQAVFYYRQSHLERFEELIQSYHDLIFKDDATLLNYIKYGIQKVTKGDSLLMDFLRILAFYADFIIYCQRFDNRKDIVAVVVKYFSEIYNYAGVRDLLQNCGSYGFLRTAAEEIIGPRVHEMSFVERIGRYRQLLQQGPPDRRRVSFSLPEESASRQTPSPEAGRLESCLSMFGSMSASQSSENGFMDELENSNLESIAVPSSIDLNAPSTSGMHVPPAGSDSEGEQSETISGEKHFKRKSNSEFKPPSILKSPHGIKSHKRTASDETASDKTKRVRTGESAGKTASQSKDEDSDISIHELLIDIPDFLSKELRVSLNKILGEILSYNKTKTETILHGMDTESPRKVPEESKDIETDDDQVVPNIESPIKEPVKMVAGSHSLTHSKIVKTSVEQIEKCKQIEKRNAGSDISDTGESSAVRVRPFDPSILNRNKTQLRGINSDVREGFKSGVGKLSDSLIAAIRDDSARSSMSEDSRIRNEPNAIAESVVRSKNLEIRRILAKVVQKIKAGNFSTPNRAPAIKPIRTLPNALDANQSKCNEMKMNVGDYGSPYVFVESIELGASVEVVTSVESDQVETESSGKKVDLDDCSKDPDTGENAPNKFVKEVASKNFDHSSSNTESQFERKETVSVLPKNQETNLIQKKKPKLSEIEHVDASNCASKDSETESNEIKMHSDDSSASSEDSKCVTTQSDSSETVELSSEDSECTVIQSDSLEFTESSYEDSEDVTLSDSSEIEESPSEDSKCVSKLGDSSEIEESASEDSKCVGDSLEIASSSDSASKLNARKDVEPGAGEVKILSDCDMASEISVPNICELDNSKTVTNGSNFNGDSIAAPESVEMITNPDSSVDNEKMECDQVGIDHSDSNKIKDTEKN